MELHPMPPLLLLLPLLQFCASVKQNAEGRGSASVSLQPGSNGSKTCSGVVICSPGILLPVWGPQSPGLGEQAARAIVYFLCLIYMFLGVSIIADRFMAAVEEKEVTITKPNGETSVTMVRIWNETVSNLTLMALGSSAPEILLSVIEVCGHGFSAGELGPGTIVGSAAFNMFVIIGICVWVVPDGESRKIKHLRVFFITAFWSVFAYIWLYLILAVITPGVVQVWEALVTLLYFPVCVILAWIADRRLLCYKYMHKHYRANKRHHANKSQGVVLETEGELTNRTETEIQDAKFTTVGRAKATENMDGNHTCITLESIELDENHKEVIRILKELKRKHPMKSLEELIELANYETLMPQQKSRAFYRMQATRRMIGAGNVLKKHTIEPAQSSTHTQDKPQEEDLSSCSCIMFEKGQYQCMENCGTISLHVTCQGGTGKNTIYLDYRTEDGSANAGSDYQFSEGTLIFRPGETKQEIKTCDSDITLLNNLNDFFGRFEAHNITPAQKSPPPPDDQVLSLSPASRVSSTKFLGVHITEDLSWNTNTTSLAKKAQQRLYFLRKLRRAKAPAPIMLSFYRGTIESILTSCITVWHGGCTASCQKTLQRTVEIIDDDVFEEEEYFFVKLLNLRMGDVDGMVEIEGECAAPKARLVEPLVATVTILDDDHCGIFSFSQPLLHVSEGIGILEVPVLRNSGACGTVILPYHSEDGTAQGGGIDYDDAHGELVFANNQTCQTLQVHIIDDQEYEKHENFFIVLEEPRRVKKEISGGLVLPLGGGDKMDYELEGHRSPLHPGTAWYGPFLAVLPPEHQITVGETPYRHPVFTSSSETDLQHWAGMEEFPHSWMA
ncbi:hypothetical protein COCON_G00076340 [Conger conger]|uniref:Calx-beta domain-containing protein n=1 Tax=Conger conger TaxID=82655 RepID=A0A9Q1DNQ0_CONCO|nr:hypothetical protein COCON_G00076340 [Conger conger]